MRMATDTFRLTRSWSTSGRSRRRSSGSGLSRLDNKTKITKKHETPTTVDAVLGGGGWRPAGGGPVSVRRYRRRAGGRDHRGWGTAGRGGRACGRRDEPSRAEGRFGEQLDAGQAGLVVVAVSDLGATRCREPMTGKPAAPAPDVLTVHGLRRYRRRSSIPTTMRRRTHGSR